MLEIEIERGTVSDMNLQKMARTVSAVPGQKIASASAAASRKVVAYIQGPGGSRDGSGRKRGRSGIRRGANQSKDGIKGWCFVRARWRIRLKSCVALLWPAA